MGKVFLALASLALMLCLPAWINGRAYPALYQSNFKHLTTYTDPYHELMTRLGIITGPKKPEKVTVSVWQDEHGNMHFSDLGHASTPDSQTYEVKTEYTGRLAYPPHWVWASMFVVWLAFYAASVAGVNLLAKRSARVKQVRIIGVAENDAQTETSHGHVEYENSNSSMNNRSNHSKAVSYAHRILGTNEIATPEEIKFAYHSKMKQYHPDKVAHLGQELQDLARKKAIEINRAYAILIK